MFAKTTRGRHGAPRQPRRWLARTRPLCGSIPELPVADAVPSMELQDGHMQQRPYDTLVLDVSVVPGAAIGYWRPAPVRTLDDYRVGDEVTVIVEDDAHFQQKAWVEAIAYARPHRQIGVRALTELGGLARLVEWYDPGELDPDPVADTLVMDAVDEDGDEAYGPFVPFGGAVEVLEPSLEEKELYAATCAASGNPLSPWERDLLGLPLDADDVQLMGGTSR